MKRDKEYFEGGSLLSRAQKRLKEKEQEVNAIMSEEDALRLINVLHIHQVELEMQTEELEEARFRAEEALELYSNLYDFSPISYLTLNREGIIIKMNLCASNLFGMDRSHLMNTRFGIFVLEDYLPVFDNFFEKGFKDRTKQACELIVESKTSSRINVRVEAEFPADKEMCNLSLIDITDIIKSKEELRLINEELTQFIRITLGNDFRMIELKQEINDLCAKANQPPRYSTLIEDQAVISKDTDVENKPDKSVTE